MTIKGLLFDKDGTLLDFDATWLPANKAAALAAARGDVALSEHLLRVGGYGPELTRVAPNAVMAAGTNREIAGVWLDHLSGWSADELLTVINRVFEEVSGDTAAPVTDLAALFQRLKGRGIKLGVATSDSRAGVEATLGRFGVLEYLDFVAGFDSGHEVKPDPGMARAFCAETGLDPADIAVIGDNLHDLEMGRRVGAGLVVGVLSGTGEHGDLTGLADHVLDSIDGLEALLDSL